jgi:hypothetical protein
MARRDEEGGRRGATRRGDVDALFLGEERWRRRGHVCAASSDRAPEVAFFGSMPERVTTANK